GREDVGQHQDRLVADPGRDGVRRQIGERNPYVFGLCAVDLVPQDPSPTTEALARMTISAVAAGAARRDARHEHAVADLDAAHRVTDLDDGADRFVTEDPPIGHRRYVALEDVE